MGSQWVRDLVTMADAVLVNAEEAKRDGQPCRFCDAPNNHGVVTHHPECPVALATAVVAQAHQFSGNSH